MQSKFKFTKGFLIHHETEAQQSAIAFQVTTWKARLKTEAASSDLKARAPCPTKYTEPSKAGMTPKMEPPPCILLGLSIIQDTVQWENENKLL